MRHMDFESRHQRGFGGETEGYVCSQPHPLLLRAGPSRRSADLLSGALGRLGRARQRHSQLSPPKRRTEAPGLLVYAASCPETTPVAPEWYYRL